MSNTTEFVRRPGLGKAGRAIKVRANFFEVKSLPDANVHHYDITITPDVPPALNRRIYQQFEHMNSKGQLGGIRPVYDGMLCRVGMATCLMLSDIAFFYSHTKAARTSLPPESSRLVMRPP